MDRTVTGLIITTVKRRRTQRANHYILHGRVNRSRTETLISLDLVGPIRQRIDCSRNFPDAVSCCITARPSGRIELSEPSLGSA